MSTEIEIKTAAFKCQTDEDIFYQRLAKVAGIKKIITQDRQVCLSVTDEKKSQAIADIGEICDIWHTSFRIKS